MAGDSGLLPALLPRNRRDKMPVKMALTAVRERWEVHFSRFFGYPPFGSIRCPDLIPLTTRIRNRRPSGNWVCSSSTALLQLVYDYSKFDVLLTVCLGGKILEEHHVSKLQYVWPQVSCNPEFPARGTRAVFISYRDCMGEVQKFALRFLSADEAERFMSYLKEIFNVGRDTEPLTDLGSEISAESEFMSSNGPFNRVCKDLNMVTTAQTYTTQISPSFKNEAEQYSRTQDMTHIHNIQSKFLAPPPGFTSLLNNRHPVVEQVAAQSTVSNDVKQNSQTQSTVSEDVNSQTHSTVSEDVKLNSQIFPPSFTQWISNHHPVVQQVPTQSTVSQEVNLISQPTRYVRDASFQDLLSKMESAISEMGGDLTLV